MKVLENIMMIFVMITAITFYVSMLVYWFMEGVKYLKNRKKQYSRNYDHFFEEDFNPKRAKRKELR